MVAIVAVEARNRIDIDKKLVEIESDINEQKNPTNTRTGAFAQRISKLENSNSLVLAIGSQMGIEIHTKSARKFVCGFKC